MGLSIYFRAKKKRTPLRLTRRGAAHTKKQRGAAHTKKQQKNDLPEKVQRNVSTMTAALLQYPIHKPRTQNVRVQSLNFRANSTTTKRGRKQTRASGHYITPANYSQLNLMK